MPSAPSTAALLIASVVLLSPAGAAAQVYTRRNAHGVVEATNVPESSDYRLTYAGKGILIHSRGFHLTNYRGQFDHHIQAAASTFSISPDLIKAVIQVESEFDHLAVSSKGAQGLMQLMPATARRFSVSDAFDPRQNIFGGSQYLRFLLDLFRGQVDWVLAGYNAGENAVLRYNGIPPYRETRNYVQKIRGLLDVLPAFSYASGGAAFFAPSATFGQPAPRAQKLVPLRPRVYYKFLDERGALHVSYRAPEDGVSYTMLRVLD
jgi:soluble lytic murein transglycosylase-like protein